MIEVSNIDFFYGRFQALQQVSFSVGPRRIAGLIGPNGSGKSTILKILCGFLAPASGVVNINGFNLAESPLETRQSIGYMPEVSSLHREMQVEEYLTFVAKLKGVANNKIPKEVRRLLEVCHLGAVCFKLVGSLSKGNRQRLALAQALIGNPKVLFLDEPTSALDPNQAKEMRELIRSMATEATILLSSHVLSEVSRLCDDVVFIRDGQIRYEGSLGTLSQSQSGIHERPVLLRFVSFEDSWREWIGRLPGGRLVPNHRSNTGELTVAVQQDEAFFPALFQLMIDRKMPLREMISQDTQLELLFQRDV